MFRNEAGRVIASLIRVTGDLGAAEELAQDALLSALEKWPETGVPDNPGAWLVATAKNRALDQMRRRHMMARKSDEIREQMATAVDGASLEEAMDDEVGDDLLRLVFIACHPILSMDARVALTLRVLCGLSTEEIARAFLSTNATIAQRIVRAKRTLSEANVPFELPRGEALIARTAAVLRVIYLVFNEGYSATTGDDVLRVELCDMARRLGGTVLSLLPDEPEVYGLVALMEIQSSRSAARVDSEGNPVLLLNQDRSLWDRQAIARGMAALMRAHLLRGRGPYVLQAEIAACHGRAQTPQETDWVRLASLYAELARLTPSPVIELNRALAVSMAEGPEAGLSILEPLRHEPALKSYHLLPAARGDMLLRLGRTAEAKAEFKRAAELASHEKDRQLLLARVAEC